MNEQISLFDGPAPPTTTEPEPPMTTGQRRRQRQLTVIHFGGHPLSLLVGAKHIPLHPDAPRTDDTTVPGPRCGTCLHRLTLLHHDDSYPKCTLPDAAGRMSRATHSEASDCRAWWPACGSYEPLEAP